MNKQRREIKQTGEIRIDISDYVKNKMRNFISCFELTKRKKYDKRRSENFRAVASPFERPDELYSIDMLNPDVSATPFFSPRHNPE